MDSDLRNRLWSALKLTVWDRWTAPYSYGYQDPDSRNVEVLLNFIWLDHFKQPLDTLPLYNNRGYQTLRDHFFRGEWWEVYDFIEFVLKTVPEEWRTNLRNFVNKFLEEENADCRIIEDEIVAITDAHEIETVESALDAGLSSIQRHLKRSLELLSDRKQPDYRNSIKEAISAVEAVCQTVSGKRKATLPDCLKALKDRKPMHPAFEQALIKHYGYTSDEGGIRHALSEESASPSYADAKFMVVSSSAFINYVLTKASELGIKVKKP